MITKIEDFDYFLPKKLIAKSSKIPRDSCRFFVYESKKDKIYHRYFYDLKIFLKSGDLLVANNSKVFPARLFAEKKTGGKVEVLLLKQTGKFWNTIIGGKSASGEKIIFSKKLSGKIVEKNGRETKIDFNPSDKKFWQEIEKIGQMPIPPYIKNSKLSESELRRDYQTVFANNCGSAAAPTAGLHFTKTMIGDLLASGIGFSTIDLHVGLGTFAPVDNENIKKKKLHSENFSIPYSTIEKILETKKNQRRIFAVGTTSVRALESAPLEILATQNNISSSTEIFIQPGDKFEIVDGLITNFHLPKSSLMILVAAFIQSKGLLDGRKKLLELYKIAIKENYRFYSFGDAMLII